MDNQLQIAPSVQDIELTAMIPAEMQSSQQKLIIWCTEKIEVTQKEEDDLWLAIEALKISSTDWKRGAIQTSYNNTKRRRVYFEKIKAALEAGYYIVPNFPITLFAIRTDRAKPLRMQNISSWSRKEQSPKELPIGDGEYKNPFPVIFQTNPGSGSTEEQQYWADHWDEMEFPISMARAELIDATDVAMKLGIFDAIGIMPAKKKEDPCIIGQIINKGKTVSFMITWHLNTNIL